MKPVTAAYLKYRHVPLQSIANETFTHQIAMREENLQGQVEIAHELAYRDLLIRRIFWAVQNGAPRVAPELSQAIGRILQ